MMAVISYYASQAATPAPEFEFHTPEFEFHTPEYLIPILTPRASI
jgi:hypothetical protein